MTTRVFDVLNLGGGVQSSRVLLGASRAGRREEAAFAADSGWHNLAGEIRRRVAELAKTHEVRQ